MPAIPRDRSLDATPALLREGYLFLSRRFARMGTDVLELRLLGAPFVALRGREGARLFHDSSRLVRSGIPIEQTLVGRWLDDEAHRHRDAMWLSLMSRERLDALMGRMWSEWYAALDRWQGRREVTLFDEAKEVLCRAACAWAGVRLEEGEAATRAAQLAASVDGGFGPRYVRGRLASRRTERWMTELVERIRRRELRPDERTAAHVIATHRQRDGAPRSAHDAAIELLDVIRPAVGLAYHVAFLAHAVASHRGYRAMLRDAGPEQIESFVQEVRRFYPFTPFLGARVRESFEWRGYRFPEGRRVLFDVYGTDHDARIWPEPDVLRPDRFVGRTGAAFDPMPRGGRLHGEEQRAGEWMTIEAMKVALTFLARGIDFRFPPQNEAISLSRMPARPVSGMRIADMRPSGLDARRPTVTRPEPRVRP